MSTVLSLVAKLGLDADAFRKGMDEAEGTAHSKGKGIQGILSGVGKVALGGLAVAATATAGLGVALAGFVSEAAAGQKVEAQLDAVLKSTSVSVAAQAKAYADAQGKMIKVGALSTKQQDELKGQIDKVGFSLREQQARLIDQQAAWDKSKNKTESARIAIEKTQKNIASLQGELGGLQGQLAGAGGKMVDMTKALGLTAPVAQITKDEILKLTNSLADVAPFEDDVILAGENMLLTFTNIGKNVFPQATETILDMATAMGSTDLQGSAIQLGKALQDPIAGVSALAKVGVNFSESQKGVIKSLVESGKMEEAQKLILKELQVEFGGSAKAAGQTFAGQMTILQNKLGNVKETIGAALLPVLTSLVGKLSGLVSGVMPKVEAIVGRVSDAFAVFSANINDTRGWLFGLKDAVSQSLQALGADEGTAESIGAFFERIGRAVELAVYSFNEWKGAGIGGFIDGLVAALASLVSSATGLDFTAIMAGWETFKSTLSTIVGFIQANAVPLLIALGAALVTLAVIQISAAVPALSATAGAAWAAAAAFIAMYWPVLVIGVAAAAVALAWKNDWGGIATFMTKFWNTTLKPIVEQIRVWFQDNIPKAIQVLANFWKNTLLPAMTAVGSWITGTLVPILKTIWDWLSTNIPRAIDTVSGFWRNTLLPAMTAVGSWITGTLVPILKTVWDWLATNIPNAINTVSGFWNNTLLPAIKAVWAFINDPLLPLFLAIVDVLDSAMSLALTAAAGLWENVLLPAIKTASNWIKDNVLPVLQDLATWFNEKVVPALESAAKWINDNVVPALKDLAGIVDGAVKTALTWLHDKLLVPLQTALEAIPDIMRKITGWFGTFAGKLDALKGKLPDWLTPGSPTPLQVGIEGIAEALTQVIPLIEDMAAALVSVSDSAPTTANLPGWMTGFKLMIEAMVAMLGSLYDAPGGAKANAIDLAKRLAEELSGVISAVSDAAAALKSLGDIDFAMLSVEKLDNFIYFIHALLFQIKEEAATWGGTEQAIKDGFALARKMVDQILDLVRIVEPATAAMQALSDASLRNIESAAYKWSWVITEVIVICDKLARIAQNLDMTGYPAAIGMATSIGQIIALIEPAAAAMVALAGVTLAELEGAAYKWSWVVTGVMVICNNLALIAANLDTSGYPAAKLFAESATKILGVVAVAVAAITSLNDLRFPPLGSFGAMAFGLQKLLEYIKAVFVQWSAKLEELADMGVFSEAAQKVLGVVQSTLDSLAALNDIQFPALGSFGVMAFGLQKILEYIKAVFVQWEEDLEQLGNMALFSEAGGKVVGLVQPLLDALKALGTLEFPPLVNFGTLSFGLQKALEAIEAVFVQWEEELDRLGSMGTFSEAAEKALALITSAIEAIAAIASYEAVKGLPTKVLNFAQDLDAVLRGLKAIAELWVTAAEETFTATALVAIGVFSTNVQAAIGFIKPTIDAIKALAEYAAAKGLDKAIAAFKLDLGTAITALGELATNPALSPEILGALGSFATALLVVIDDLQATVKALSAIAGYEKGKAVKAVQSLTEDVNDMAIYLWNMQNTLEGDMGVGAATRIEEAATSINGALSRAFEKLGIVSGSGVADGVESFASKITTALGNIKSSSQSLRDSWVSNWGDITAAVNTAIGAVQRFKAAIDSVDIPPALEGHSPPPLANWMAAIAEATKDATAQMGNFAQRTEGAGAREVSVSVPIANVNINNGQDVRELGQFITQTVRNALATTG